MQPAKSLSQITQLLYLIFFISLACSFRAIISISVALIIIAGIIKNYSETKKLFHRNIKDPFFISCLVLFLVHVVGLIYTKDLQQGWNDIQLKSGLLLVPLAVCCTNYINAATREKLLYGYCGVITVACLSCLFIACMHYFQSGDTSVFFYHTLVKPFHQHAGYLSALVFIALIFLIESLLKNRLFFRQSFCISVIVFLSVFLFLLSSKLVIVFYLLCLFYLLIVLIKRKKNRVVTAGLFIVILIVSTVVLFIRNPVSDRFNDIFDGNLAIIKQEKFTPGRYFNGLQFRLLQWKFTGEILSENNRWWYGVSPGDAQSYLDQKYISKNMYAGDTQKGTRGFLGYNTHNQFLETLLQSGVLGLLCLFAVCFFMLRIAWLKKDRVVSMIVLLLLAWLFSESVLETQLGIVIFTFFPLFFSYD